MRRQLFFLLILVITLTVSAYAQPPEPKQRIRTVTIPVTIFTKKELKERRAEESVLVDDLSLKEDKEIQQILSIRSVSDSPLSIALVVQDDLANDFNLQIKDIQDFIRHLPIGTRVMVVYARSGSVQVRQRFTDDLEKAAKSLRIVTGSPEVAPRSPYESVSDVLGRFDAVPAGRRAVLLFSDGLDASGGLSLASITQSFDLEQAILKAQRKGVAVYSIYSPTTITNNGNTTYVMAAQGALSKLAEETGGRTFQQGSIAPISLLPFFKDLVTSLNRQFSLTFVSTHMDKGYHKLLVQSTNPEIKIEHPKGYYYR